MFICLSCLTHPALSPPNPKGPAANELLCKRRVAWGRSTYRKVEELPRGAVSLPSNPWSWGTFYLFLLAHRGGSGAAPGSLDQIDHIRESFVNFSDQWLTTLRKDYFHIKTIFKLCSKDPKPFLRILSKWVKHAQAQWILWHYPYWIFLNSLIFSWLEP